MNLKQFTASLIILLPALAAFAQHGTPPVKAPFEKLDLYCVNDWWVYNEEMKDNPKKIIDVDVPRDEVICFGMYTVQGGVMKMTAQLFPLYPEESREVSLELKQKGKWEKVATEKVNDIGWSTLFRIEKWDDSKDVEYRLRHGEKASFEGLIRKNPKNKNEIVVGSLNCNSNHTRGLREEYIRNLKFLNPDLLFFAGDQSYDHKEHTAAWLLFGIQFRDIFRDRPCITIPDDHDIGQGNLWGQNGKKSMTSAGNDGGYFYHPEYIKMVERCQTSHLPDAYDPTPIEQGIGVYYTRLTVGGVDFAIVEDRKFKTGPAGTIPQMGPRPDHIRDSNYDPKTIDVPGLKLLGDRQLKFLDDWGQQWDGVELKAVLSQTGFCGGAHRHGNFNNILHADLDSNGWPQTGRKKALKAIRAAGAVHLAGDQHLPTIVQHGIDEYGDGPFAFVAPAIVNNYYSRWWHPENEKAGKDPEPGNPLPFNGNYFDGMGNKIRMIAYANPDENFTRGGFGLVRFNKNEKSVTFESWDRSTDVTKPGAKQMPGWPRTIRQNGTKEGYPVWKLDPLK
ncbi:metallophosphoesterase family protein [Prolixibacteraceae bacterium Z1-6]|uniref:Metallophosphoesterase family protein n=1 Tax=Draconibacterium aestuarii TaxID=2998507 RepID=A0A9X3F892_9BACT|nr:metallophosphoesterase family protein [Prolixibacteraceae bacterium Z1-6]